MKYPIELEITNYCSLQCKCCPNSSFQERVHMSFLDFQYVINYIDKNKEHILFLDISGIGDIFLHPEIDVFLRLLGERFSDKKLDILIPSKLTFIRNSTLNILRELTTKYHLSYNISIWIYSMRASIHDAITKLPGSFLQTVKMMKILKNLNIPFSLELMINQFSSKEEDVFIEFAQAFGVNYKVHNFHNFWGSITNFHAQKYNQPHLKWKCSFADDETYELDFYCKYTLPFIGSNGFLYWCSHGGKQEKFKIDTLSNTLGVYTSYPDLLKFITKTKLNPDICKWCTYFLQNHN